MISLLEEMNIDLTKCICATSDGAHNMQGRKNGACLKFIEAVEEEREGKNVNLQQCIRFTCNAHKLNLTIKALCTCKCCIKRKKSRKGNDDENNDSSYDSNDEYDEESSDYDNSDDNSDDNMNEELTSDKDERCSSCLYYLFKFKDYIKSNAFRTQWNE